MQGAFEIIVGVQCMCEGIGRVQCTFEGIRGVQHKGNPLHEGGLFTDQAYLLQQWPS